MCVYAFFYCFNIDRLILSVFYAYSDIISDFKILPGLFFDAYKNFEWILTKNSFLYIDTLDLLCLIFIY